MDDQHLQIRELRKALLDFDRPDGDHGCELDLELWRFDEKIEFDVQEPNVEQMWIMRSRVLGDIFLGYIWFHFLFCLGV